MSRNKVKIIGMCILVGVCCARCHLITPEENDDTLLLGALLLANNSSSSSSSSVTATFNITNNSGATASYTFHVAGATCTNIATNSTGSVTAGSIGTLSVDPDASGYDISDGTNCNALATGTSAGTFTCTDPGGGGLFCN